ALPILGPNFTPGTFTRRLGAGGWAGYVKTVPVLGNPSIFHGRYGPFPIHANCWSKNFPIIGTTGPHSRRSQAMVVISPKVGGYCFLGSFCPMNAKAVWVAGTKVHGRGRSRSRGAHRNFAQAALGAMAGNPPPTG